MSRQSPGLISRIALQMARARSGSTTMVVLSGMPVRISSMMASGSSVRGLSEVTMARSAREAAMDPMMGRLVRSLSPPQPNTARSLPRVKARAFLRTVSRASGVWA